jgi:photosystem II stability/assembly factor-like uncharacterized protein
MQVGWRKFRSLGAAAALPLLSLSPTAFGQPPTEGRDIEKRRAEDIIQQRAFPVNRVPADGRLRAIEAMKHLTPNSAAASGGSWTLVGPRPILETGGARRGAMANAMVVDPRNSNVVYMGAPGGGVWKTTDGGVNWTPLTDQQNSLAVGAIALDPVHPDTIYVGTGNLLGGIYGAGVLKSTDGGTTWTDITGPFVGPFTERSSGGGAHIVSIVVNPANTQIVLAGVSLDHPAGCPHSLDYSGVYRSTDGGATWTSTPVFPVGTATAVLFDPVNANVAYAAIGEFFCPTTSQNGIYKSTDAGLTWSPMNGSGANKLPASNSYPIYLAQSASTPATLYAAIVGNPTVIYKTTDGGTNWTPTTRPPLVRPNGQIAVHPANANIVFVGAEGLYRSLDGGSTWSQINTGVDGVSIFGDIRSMGFSAGGAKLYVGDDGGPHSTLDAANAAIHWSNLCDTVATNEYYPGISVHPTDPIVFGGTQDHGITKYSGSLLWTTVQGCDGGWTAINPVTPSIVYGTCPLGGSAVIQKSASNGDSGTWFSAQNGVNLSDRMILPPLVMDPSNPQRLYFGTNRVYLTIDGASNWTAVSGSLPTTDDAINTIAAGSDGNTVYMGSNDGVVQVTTNASAGAGATWNTRTAGLPTRSVTQFAVDPAIPATAYVTFSGFTLAPDTKGHVFKTTNSGTSWIDISSNLPDIPADDIVIDPDIPNTLYLATDIGVFRSTNGGGSWSVLGTGLPRTLVLGMRLQRTTRMLFASTFGRSVWTLPVPGPYLLTTSVGTGGAAAGSISPTSSLYSPGSVVQVSATANAGFGFSGFSGDLTGAVNPKSIVMDAPKSVTANFISGNSVPAITSLSPQNAVAGASGFTLTVNGNGFSSNSTVNWNGSSRSTSFVNANQLQATITTTDLATAGTVAVTVLNPAPGGGLSGSYPFVISSVALGFVPVAPCRVMDTRNPNGPLGGPFIAGGSTRTVPIPSSACAVPGSATAYSLNITVVPRKGTLGYLTIWPFGQPQPVVSTLNSPDGSVLANAAIVPAGASGGVNVFVTHDVDLVIDINGYFKPPAAGTLQFYPLPPCRVLDTRGTNAPLGGPAITAGSSRSFPIPSSSCNVPNTAAAYSFNVTAVPHGGLGYLTAWPTGQTQPNVSTLNAIDGTVLANAAIVQAGTAGAVSIFASNTSDLVVDINGYFGSPASGGLNFYAVTPCRVVDTRNAAGPLGGPIISVDASRTFPITSSACGLPASASAYSFNMTVAPPGFLGYLSVWPAGQAKPNVSTLNDSKGIVTANAALVPAGTSGSINVFVLNDTHVIIDTNGYFGQ